MEFDDMWVTVVDYGSWKIHTAQKSNKCFVVGLIQLNVE